jgi:hypothetical protein
LEFLHDAYKDQRIGLVKYSELGEATVEQMIKLGEVWEAGIDAPGWRKTWERCLAEAILQRTKRTNARAVDTTGLGRGRSLQRRLPRSGRARLRLRNHRFQNVPFRFKNSDLPPLLSSAITTKRSSWRRNFMYYADTLDLTTCLHRLVRPSSQRAWSLRPLPRRVRPGACRGIAGT